MQILTSLDRLFQATAKLNESINAKLGVYEDFEKNMNTIGLHFPFGYHFLNDGVGNHYLEWKRHEGAKRKNMFRLYYAIKYKDDEVTTCAVLETKLEIRQFIYPYFENFVHAYTLFIEKKTEELNK